MFSIVSFNSVPIVSSSGPATAGEIYSLICSATLIDPIPLPTDLPSPTFEWFFGPNGNASVPIGVILQGTTSNNTSTNITYTSTLQFSPLSRSNVGKYTCRLGAGRLANSANVAVNGIKSCKLATLIVLIVVDTCAMIMTYYDCKMQHLVYMHLKFV